MSIIRGEMYKFRVSKTYHWINLFIASVCVVYALYLKLMTDTTKDMFIRVEIPEKTELLLVIPLLFSFVFIDEYRFATIKNQIIMIGNRNRLILAKAVFQYAVTMISYAVAAGILVITYCILPAGEEDQNVFFGNLVVFFLLFAIIILRALAMINLLSVLSKSYLIVSLFFIIFVSLINLILSVVGSYFDFAGKLIKYTLQTEMTMLMKTVQNGEIAAFLARNIVAVAVIYCAICIGNFLKYKIKK